MSEVRVQKTPELRDRLCALVIAGAKQREIAAVLGISRSEVSKILHDPRLGAPARIEKQQIRCELCNNLFEPPVRRNRYDKRDPRRTCSEQCKNKLNSLRSRQRTDPRREILRALLAQAS